MFDFGAFLLGVKWGIAYFYHAGWGSILVALVVIRLYGVVLLYFVVF